MPAPTFMMEKDGRLGILGVAGFVLAARRAADERSRAAHLSVLLNALVLPLAALMISFGLWSTYRLNPVYDARVYAFEETLGIRVPALVASAFPQLKPISNLADCVLHADRAGPEHRGCVAAVKARRARRSHRGGGRRCLRLRVYFICPVVGTVGGVWRIVPACTPRRDADAPYRATRRAAERYAVAAHGLGTPGVVQRSRNAGRARAQAGTSTVCRTALFAVFGPDGQHWLLDVVVAVPLAVGIQTICVPSRADTSARTTAIVSALFVAASVAERPGRQLAGADAHGDLLGPDPYDRPLATPADAHCAGARIAGGRGEREPRDGTHRYRSPRAVSAVQLGHPHRTTL